MGSSGLPMAAWAACRCIDEIGGRNRIGNLFFFTALLKRNPAFLSTPDRQTIDGLISPYHLILWLTSVSDARIL
jgi:hypothetical protein